RSRRRRGRSSISSLRPRPRGSSNRKGTSPNCKDEGGRQKAKFNEPPFAFLLPTFALTFSAHRSRSRERAQCPLEAMHCRRDRRGPAENELGDALAQLQVVLRFAPVAFPEMHARERARNRRPFVARASHRLLLDCFGNAH